jgi:hypothetical protein
MRGYTEQQNWHLTLLGEILTETKWCDEKKTQEIIALTNLFVNAIILMTSIVVKMTT